MVRQAKSTCENRLVLVLGTSGSQLVCTSFAKTPDTWYLPHEGNADEVVHKPSLPSESPATISVDESEHMAVIAASIAPPPPPSPPVRRRNHLTAGAPFLSALSRDPNAPFSHGWLEKDLGIGMEAEAIDPSEYPTTILDAFEVAPETTGADKPELFGTNDFAIDACLLKPDTEHRAKHVASVPVVVATGKLPAPPLLPIPGGVKVSRDASWIATQNDTVKNHGM